MVDFASHKYIEAEKVKPEIILIGKVYYYEYYLKKCQVKKNQAKKD